MPAGACGATTSATTIAAPATARASRVRNRGQSSAQNAAIQHAIEEVKGRGIPAWLTFDTGALTGRVTSLPTREQINLPVQEQLIVEYYSKK